MFRLPLLPAAAATLALLPLAAAVAGTAPVEYRFNPVADTSIYADVSGNDLKWDDVSDGQGSSLWLSTTAGGVVRRSLIRFDLGAIPDHQRVTSVTLTLYESRSRDDHDVALHRLLAPWGEGSSNGGAAGVGAAATPGDATWRWRDYGQTEWTNRGGDFAATASANLLVGPQNSFYTWQSTPGLVADVQGWLDDPGSSFGWILIGREDDAQIAKRFDSRESLAADLRPLLVVQTVAVPEPASAALFGIGALAVLWRRRQRPA